MIIGNPPYGADLVDDDKEFLKKSYPISTTGKIDTYRIFIEKCFIIGNEKSLISLIVPNTFMYNVQSYSLRKLIFEKSSIYDAVELRKNIFEDAPDVVTVIISLINNIHDAVYALNKKQHDEYVCAVIGETFSNLPIEKLFAISKDRSPVPMGVDIQIGTQWDNVEDTAYKPLDSILW